MTRLRPERLVAGGDALARLDDGRIVFVPGALPGEVIEAEIVSDRSDFARAELLTVLEPSADRVVPLCPHRQAGCGGCGWMHLRSEAQLAAKVAIVAESLRRIGHVDADEIDRCVVAGDAVPSAGYRTSLRVHGTDDGVAFREERSDRSTPITDCLVAHPQLSDMLAGLTVAAGVELSLRVSVATGAATARWQRPRRPRRRRGAPAEQPATPAVRAVDGLPRGVHIGDSAFLVERVAGVELRVSAPSFFQSGAAAATLLVDAVSRAAPELDTAGHVVDAYGGVGLFAATVMRRAGHVTLVESERASVEDARHNLDHRGAASTVVRSEFGAWRAEAAPVDVLVVDPARPGLGKPGVAAALAASPPVLVAVHCDPVSLGRDARWLAEGGYRPERVEVLDLFPQTPHVETVTRFTR